LTKYYHTKLPENYQIQSQFYIQYSIFSTHTSPVEPLVMDPLSTLIVFYSTKRPLEI